MSKRAMRRHHIKRVAKNRRQFDWTGIKGNTSMAARSDNELATCHPFDCGRRCLLCHGEKFLRKTRRRRQENTAALTYESKAW